MNSNDRHEANKLFAKCLCIICIVLVILSVVARILNILWFDIDYTVIEIPSETTQIFIKTILKLIELTLIFKILCDCGWFTCTLLAGINTLISGFISGLLLNIFNVLYILIVPIFFHMKNWKYSLLDNIILYLVLLLYSATFLFGRVGAISDLKMDFVVSVLCATDYNLFIFSLYLVVSIFGGIKLWRTQRRPLFKRKVLPED